MKNVSKNVNQPLKSPKGGNPDKKEADIIQSHDRKTKIGTFEKWYYISTYALATVALVGLSLSIWTSSKSSKTSDEIVKTLIAFIEPIINFDQVILLPVPPSIDCENPPKLVNVTYRNGSNIPIKLLVKSDGVYFGETSINTGPRPEPPKEYSVLAPGESWGLTVGISNEVREMMKHKVNPFQPPFLTISFNFLISTLNGQKSYDVHLEHRIGLDCNQYFSPNVTTIKEIYIPNKGD